MDYMSMAKDVQAVLEREGIERACVAGHSMGGKVAMVMALTCPEQVRCLIAADIAPVTYQRSHDTLIFALQAVDVANAASRAQIDSELSKQIDAPQVRQFLMTNLLAREGGGYYWRIPLSVLADAVPEIEGFPVIDGVYTDPSLFVYGSESGYFRPQRDSFAVEHYFPNAEYVEIPGAGHWLHAEKPEEFNRTLANYLLAKGIIPSL
jgi:esterase